MTSNIWQHHAVSPSFNVFHCRLTGLLVFNPHLKVQSDADAMRNAKLEAMGLPPEMDTRGYIKERDNRRDVATDEQVRSIFLRLTFLTMHLGYGTL